MFRLTLSLNSGFRLTGAGPQTYYCYRCKQLDSGLSHLFLSHSPFPGFVSVYGLQNSSAFFKMISDFDITTTSILNNYSNPSEKTEPTNQFVGINLKVSANFLLEFFLYKIFPQC